MSRLIANQYGYQEWPCHLQSSSCYYIDLLRLLLIYLQLYSADQTISSSRQPLALYLTGYRIKDLFILLQVLMNKAWCWSSGRRTETYSGGWLPEELPINTS